MAPAIISLLFAVSHTHFKEFNDASEAKNHCTDIYNYK